MAAPAKLCADIFQGSQGFAVNAQLQVGRSYGATDLLQDTFAKSQPGFTSQIKPFNTDISPLVFVNQAIKQAARIHIKVELATEIAAEEVFSNQSKAGKLLGCGRLHGTPRCTEQALLISQIELRYIKVAKLTLIISNA